MANDNYCLKPFFYYLSLCGINGFPNDVRLAVPLKIAHFISKTFVKFFTVFMMVTVTCFIIYIIIIEARYGWYSAGYNFSRGFPLLLIVIAKQVKMSTRSELFIRK